MYKEDKGKGDNFNNSLNNPNTNNAKNNKLSEIKRNENPNSEYKVGIKNSANTQLNIKNKILEKANKFKGIIANIDKKLYNTFTKLIEELNNPSEVKKERIIYEFIENKTTNYLNEIFEKGKIYTKLFE
ncbi:MAG: hypothetical protein ACP5RQ_03235, partial [Candidatus Micrarchaeia archaeon]